MAFMDPQSIVDQCGLSEGRLVLDCGCGDGAFTLIAARCVGDFGKVYALDIQHDVLVRLKNTAAKQHFNNVELINADIEEPHGTKLGSETIDIAIISNLMFQLQNRELAVAEIQRILKPNGRVAVIDWTDSFNGLGPQPNYLITEESMKEYFKQQNFKLEKSVNAGDHHYGLIFRKV